MKQKRENPSCTGKVFAHMKIKIYHIESIEKCNRFLASCQQYGYRVFQMQYDWNDPNGFHAWFQKIGTTELIEIVTHNKAVQDNIVNFNPSW